MRGENKYFNQTVVIVFAFFQFVDKQVWMGGGRSLVFGCWSLGKVHFGVLAFWRVWEEGGGRWEEGDGRSLVFGEI